MKLAGNLCLRNANSLDYCWREALASLLGVCDTVSISDCESTDGTQEEVRQLVANNPRLSLNVYPWTDPKADPNWFPNWINYARQHIAADMFLHLDADEVLHQKDYPTIRRLAEQGGAYFFHRYNFFRDNWHLIPEGHCCGHKVLRMARTTEPIPSDYPFGPAEPTVARATESGCSIYHYGFLRHREAYFRKAREVLRIWANSYDPRLEAAEKYEGDWSTMPGLTGWEDKLVPYVDSHPAAIFGWLIQRGFRP